MTLKIVKLIVCYSFLFLTNPCFGQSAGTTNDTLRVLTLNLFGKPNSNWSTRQTMILRELSARHPGLIAFQEVIEPGNGTDVWAKAIADSLFKRTGIKYDYVYERTHFSWKRWFEGVAILSSHIILNSEARSLPPGLFPRTVVWCRLLTPAGIVNFFSTHLSFGDQEPVRKDQVQAIRSFVAEKSADGVAVANIVCGDFNAIPDALPVLAMTSPDSGVTFLDSWVGANPHRAGFTVPSGNPDARIDYIFINDRDPVKIISSTLAFDQSNLNGLYASDHLGVFSTVTTTQPKLNVNILIPASGAEVKGEVPVSWSLSPQSEPVTIMLYVSIDAGLTWTQEWIGQSADNTYLWNTTSVSDGARYKIRIAAIGDRWFGMGQSESSFRVHNSGERLARP